MNTTTKTQTTNRTDCLCGCGQTTSATANYRPGHDARHVSNLLADLVATGNFDRATADAMSTRLPSLPLRVKFLNAVDKMLGRGSAPKGRNKGEVVVFESGDVKVGRWSYPAREVQVLRGDEIAKNYIERNTKRDGSGEWVFFTAL